MLCEIGRTRPLGELSQVSVKESAYVGQESRTVRDTNNPVTSHRTKAVQLWQTTFSVCQKAAPWSHSRRTRQTENRTLPAVSRQIVDLICASYAGAQAADLTTELDSWKVGGKMFACFGDRIDGVCVKTDSVETARMLIDAGAATKAPYFHQSWVLVGFDSPLDELRHRIAVSYDIIFKGLPKKLRDEIAQP